MFRGNESLPWPRWKVEIIQTRCQLRTHGKNKSWKPNSYQKLTYPQLISATRIALPAFDPVELEKLIFALLSVDGKKWLPKNDTFLYIRPTMIGSAAGLGVMAPREATLFVIVTFMPSLSTVGGMRLLASQNGVRAWPGGFGFAKVGANYGPSLMATSEARARGYDQVLWLLNGKVTEAGASNFFMVWKTKEGKTQLVTAPLGDKIILDGVTRRSILQLTRERLGDELEIVEREFTMEDVVEAVNEGRIVEAFAAGTAVSFSPSMIKNFVFPGFKLTFGTVLCGTCLSDQLQRCGSCHANGRGRKWEIHRYHQISKFLPSLSPVQSSENRANVFQWLVNIMYGKEDHPWGVVVNERE